jgi:hypothetical protein
MDQKALLAERQSVVVAIRTLGTTVLGLKNLLSRQGLTETTRVRAENMWLSKSAELFSLDQRRLALDVVRSDRGEPDIDRTRPGDSGTDPSKHKINLGRRLGT